MPGTGAPRTEQTKQRTRGESQWGTPVPRASCVHWMSEPYLRRFAELRESATGEVCLVTGMLQNSWNSKDRAKVEETKQFPEIERRRNPGLPEDRRQAGEV